MHYKSIIVGLMQLSGQKTTVVAVCYSHRQAKLS